MPRYFFHVQDGFSMPDIEGTVLPDPDAAREEAIRLSAALLKEHAEAFWTGEPLMLEVHDEADRYLFGLTFTAQSNIRPPPSNAGNPSD
jgi:hypothetical protein